MISETDINDWDFDQTVYLYNVPNKSKILFDGQEYFFDHIDGMYSYCTDLNGAIVHLNAMTKVHLLKNET